MGEQKAPSTMAIAMGKKKPETGRQVALGCGGCLTLFLGIIGLLSVSATLWSEFATSPLKFFIATFLAFLICAPYALFYVWIDRNEQEPWPLLAAAFLWGAVASTGLSIIGNEFSRGVFSAFVQDPMMVSQLTASLSAPLFEEITKGFALVLIYVMFPKHFDNVLDGVVYGALAGLGFATVENILYYVRAESIVATFWVRGIVAGVGSHAAYSAIFGAGLGAFRVMRTGGLRYIILVASMALAMFVHFVWNSVGQLFLAGVQSGVEALFLRIPLQALVVNVPFFIAMLVTAVFALRHESKLIKEYLSTEDRSIVKEEDLEFLLPARRRVWREWKLLFGGKFSDYMKVTKRNKLLIRLAFEKWHMRAETGIGDHETAQGHAVEVIELRKKLA